ncbi:MAG: sigma-70 family RNA polymerase sigma factor [bacterium]|nr:sigma-70 family RNA polymerase sigma factor [bacterium]
MALPGFERDQPPPRPGTTLLLAARAGESAAQSDLFDYYHELLLRIVACQLGRPTRACRAEVEDIVQDSLLEAYADLETATPATEGRFRRWLVTLTFNNMRDHLRRAKVRQRVQPLRTTLLGKRSDHRMRQPLSRAASREDWERTERALLKLSAEDREAISMRGFQAMSAAEIAEALDLASPEAARTRVSRARAKLQQKLTELS